MTTIIGNIQDSRLEGSYIIFTDSPVLIRRVIEHIDEHGKEISRAEAQLREHLCYVYNLLVVSSEGDSKEALAAREEAQLSIATRIEPYTVRARNRRLLHMPTYRMAASRLS